jgi:hypothetical protein
LNVQEVFFEWPRCHSIFVNRFNKSLTMCKNSQEIQTAHQQCSRLCILRMYMEECKKLKNVFNAKNLHFGNCWNYYFVVSPYQIQMLSMIILLLHQMYVYLL